MMISVLFLSINSNAQIMSISKSKSKIDNTELPVNEVLTTKGTERLQGPAAKNYKHWKDDSKSTYSAVSTTAKPRLMGPAAKNYKPWRDKKNAETSIVKINPDKPRLIGPAAKNKKPWKNK